ncbi:nuclear transcription factor Y subunit B-7-like [Momordica charantia]|uniref:Nuclear transcription factor Y subunit B-7-like n=1 Tax=Momordica charantia TaxID=3673 RepID=A0A6J1C9Y3_MOMCH|nr:nuclear transcription factor Y subunit B-7-like [Momordica charantia]
MEGDSGADASEISGNGGILKEPENLLPIANVGRLMKQILPANAKISKEAKETMQECASEFIGFVTGEASEKCRRDARRTVTGDDLCSALESLGFDDFAGPLRRYLCKYREQEEDEQKVNKSEERRRLRWVMNPNDAVSVNFIRA